MHTNTVLSVEQHLLLSEYVVRHAKRHDGVICADAVPVSDEQQISAEKDVIGIGQVGAREQLQLE